MVKLLKNKFIVFIFFLFLVLIFKYNTLNLPLYWDSINLGETIYQFMDSYPKVMVIPEGIFLIHPPLMPYAFASLSKIFGFNIMLFHLTIIFISSVCLYYMYLISYEIFNDRILALFPSITLFFLPLYFSFSGRIYYPIPLTCITVICFYYLLKNKYFAFSFFCTLGVLIKETFVLIIPAAFIWALLNKKIKKINFIYLFIPVLILSIWIILLKTSHPSNFFTFNGKTLINFELNPIIIGDWFRYLLRRFIKNSNFILTIPVMIYLLLNRNFLKKQNFVFVIFIISYLCLSLFADIIPRYLLPVYPIIIILFYKSIRFYFKSFNIKMGGVFLFITLFTILLFLPSYHVKGDHFCGCIISRNMDYLDNLRTQQKAIKFVEENYENKTFLVGWPLNRMLELPYLGYTTKKIKATEVDEKIKLEDFDIIIKSSQICKREELSETMNELIYDKKLKLIKRFQIRDRYTEIYEKID